FTHITIARQQFFIIWRWRFTPSAVRGTPSGTSQISCACKSITLSPAGKAILPLPEQSKCTVSKPSNRWRTHHYKKNGHRSPVAHRHAWPVQGRTECLRIPNHPLFHCEDAVNSGKVSKTVNSVSLSLRMCRTC